MWVRIPPARPTQLKSPLILTRKANRLVSLVDKLAAPPAPRTYTKSQIEVWVDSLTEKERTAVLAAALDDAWNTERLYEALVSEGAPRLNSNAYRTWRRKVRANS